MVDRTRFLAKLTEEDRKLIKLFQDEVDRINLLYMKAIHSNDMTKANQLLKQMKKISNHLTQEYWKRAEVRLPQEYVKGTSYIDEVLKMDMVLENLSKQSIEAYLDELGPIHIEAVNALVDNSKNYVRSSLDGMERQAISMINELQQTQVREELAKGIISGEAKSNDRLIDYFTSQGISGFKDRGGKYWSMDRYVDMLVRTETSIANTQGTINRGLELGITKFGIVEHPDCCELCAEMNGDIVDIRDGVVELPPFHPNCRGYIYAVINEEDLDKEKIIPTEEQTTPTEEQTKQPNEREEFKLTEEMKQNSDIKQAMNHIDMKIGNGNFTPPMGYDKAVAVSSYTTYLYKEWNNVLRHGGGGEMYSQLTKAMEETILDYGEDINKTLYRGTRLRVDAFNEIRETNKYSDESFFSFSEKKSVANKFIKKGGVPVLFELENGRGFRATDYSVFSTEAEIIINRKTQFEVTSISEEKNYFKIKIKQILD